MECNYHKRDKQDGNYLYIPTKLSRLVVTVEARLSKLEILDCMLIGHMWYCSFVLWILWLVTIVTSSVYCGVYN